MVEWNGFSIALTLARWIIFWGYIKSKRCKDTLKMADELKQAIRKAVRTIDADMLH